MKTHSLKSVIIVMAIITLFTGIGMYFVGYNVALAKQKALTSNCNDDFNNRQYITESSIPITWGTYVDKSQFPLSDEELNIIPVVIQTEEPNPEVVPEVEEAEPIEEEEVPVIEEPEYQIYVVQSGDSFWKIARDFYGDGRVWQYIVDCNDWDRSKQVLRVGTELKIYDLPEDYNYVSKALSLSNSSKTLSSSGGSDQGYEFHKWSQDTVDSVDTSNMTYLGEYHITGYDPYCDHCNGKHDGITASGIPAIYNYTVAVKGLDFGTKIYIEGYGIYEVHDRPANKGIVDIACTSHTVCYDVTRQNVPVYIIDE